ncbi:cytochrome c biogenesis protein CcsA [Plantactinospora sp. ZYX-F-223]|uniref:cytochrome c biogenesis protein CcsA n=1 Tax=Plantactinospora sp. ZYX-F-223 TaxID=3144103 RepID=UPI0031FDC4FC
MGLPRPRSENDQAAALRTPLTSGRRAGGDRRSLGWLAAGLAAAATATGLLIAPPDALQGDAQRLMYLHVPAAWTAYLAFASVLAASLGYLATRDLRWDRCARVAAELGVGLTGLTISLGALWGRAVWGAWWAWDPRLVSTALLLVVYAGYLALRRALDPADGGGEIRIAHRAARVAALVGMAGFALVPLVHLSVVWWRSLHQPATILAPQRPPIDPLMAAALLLSVAAFTATAMWIFLRRLDAVERTVARPAPAATPELLEAR